MFLRSSSTHRYRWDVQLLMQNIRRPMLDPEKSLSREGYSTGRRPIKTPLRGRLFPETKNADGTYRRHEAPPPDRWRR